MGSCGAAEPMEYPKAKQPLEGMGLRAQCGGRAAAARHARTLLGGAGGELGSLCQVQGTRQKPLGGTGLRHGSV